MREKPVFRGVATALITPFRPLPGGGSEVDYGAYGRLIDWQIEQGINALVIAGTTGEGSTLTYDEHQEVVAFAVKQARGRVPIIAATGSNDTARAIELSQFACKAGADALLLVTPYYNKATQKGLVAMYRAIADASTVPAILYNVPSRTGINIEPATYAELADHPRIAGIKEANGNISKIVETAALVEGRMDLYSGNDDQIVPILSVGGQGVISVLSNIMPAKTVEMCDLFFRGDLAGSAALQKELFPLVSALFCEVNPIPVKAAMAAMGWCENCLRLPLIPMEKPHWEKLRALMEDQGLLA